jgi:hypothetical protein
VPRVGVEPTCPFEHYALNVARLPFRHLGPFYQPKKPTLAGTLRAASILSIMHNVANRQEADHAQAALPEQATVLDAMQKRGP